MTFGISDLKFFQLKSKSLTAFSFLLSFLLSRNCDPVLAKAGLSKRSMTARLGKTAEEIRKLDYCREGLRRMRRGETKKYKRRKEKEEGEEEEEAKKKKKKTEKKKTMMQTTTASSSSTSTCCIVDAAMERANSSKALVAKVVAKEEEKSKIRGEGEEEEETDTPIVVDEARENAAMALILIAMRG